MRKETILLLEARPFATSEYAGLLSLLGYTQLLYSNYADGVAFTGSGAHIDAVMAVWIDGFIAADRFARAVANASGLRGVRGALVVSPFATADNARLLGRSGVRAWVRPPVIAPDLAARLQVLIHGERRQRLQTVAAERRLSLYAAPMPA